MLPFPVLKFTRSRRLRADGEEVKIYISVDMEGVAGG